MALGRKHLTSILMRVDLPKPLNGFWRRYGLAIATFGASLLIRMSLEKWMPFDRGVIVFVPAVVVTTFWAGFEPGVLTAVLSGVAIWYFFLPPKYTFAIDPADGAALATYIVVISIVIGLIHWLRLVFTQLESEKERSESLVAQAEALTSRERLLVQELQHRTKNLYAVIHGLAVRSLEGQRDLTEAREAFLGRLLALSRADQRILDASGAALRFLVQLELEPFADRFVAEGPDIVLDSKTAQSFSLVLHELATNASKHGALSVPSGHVFAHWKMNETGPLLNFTWQEKGGPPIIPPRRRGFGTSLLKSALGPSNLQYLPEGLKYEVQVKIEKNAD